MKKYEFLRISEVCDKVKQSLWVSAVLPQYPPWG